MAETPGKMYALGAVFSILPIPFVALRFQARRRSHLPVSWDDWLVVISMLATIATGILLIVGASVGNEGGHTIVGPDGLAVQNRAQEVARQTTYANTISQILALGPTKLSVLLFYRRVFRGVIFDIVSWILMSLVVAWTIAFFFTNLLICIPIRPSLNTAVIQKMGGVCIPNNTNMFLAQSYADFSLDFLILILPLPIIAKLQMRLTRKLQCAAIFMVGAVTVAASVARTAVQYGVAQQAKAGNPDQANYQAPIVYWPLIEASLGVVAASLPTLRPVVEHWSKSTWARSLRSLIYRASGSRSRGLDQDAISLGSRNPSPQRAPSKEPNLKVVPPPTGIHARRDFSVTTDTLSSANEV